MFCNSTDPGCPQHSMYLRSPNSPLFSDINTTTDFVKKIKKLVRVLSEKGKGN